MVPLTRHYSWPKAGALLGIGKNSVFSVHVDLDGRMQVEHLVELLELCLEKRFPSWPWLP